MARDIIIASMGVLGLRHSIFRGLISQQSQLNTTLTAVNSTVGKEGAVQAYRKQYIGVDIARIPVVTTGTDHKDRGTLGKGSQM